MGNHWRMAVFCACVALSLICGGARIHASSSPPASSGTPAQGAAPAPSAPLLLRTYEAAEQAAQNIQAAKEKNAAAESAQGRAGSGGPVDENGGENAGTDEEGSRAGMLDTLRKRIAQKKPPGDKYVRPSLENLSKLYWALGMMNMDYQPHIDNFLLINECGIFKNYYNNEIEWQKITNATKSDIRRNIDKFPTQLQVTTILNLDRYNTDLEYFDLSPSSQIVDLRNIDVAENQEFKVCGVIGEEIEGYPKNIIVKLTRYFTLTKVPVPSEIASIYFKYVKENPRYIPGLGERPAYLRLKVKALQFDKMERGAKMRFKAAIIGKLEGYEVYADPELTIPIFIYNPPPANKKSRAGDKDDYGINIDP